MTGSNNPIFRTDGIPPDNQDFTREFRLTFRRDGSKESIRLPDLSSGEASIVRFIFMMYAAAKRLFWLKLLVLDEPDSHLHAVLISTFLRLLQRLVDEQGTRVIMTTHRVETIGFTPPECVFIMHRDQPRIRRCDDKVRTIGMLSGNLFGMILADKRPVFVEDQDDVKFHTLALTLLRESGQWPHRISPQFIPVSQWVQVTRQKGGKGAVRTAVKKLSESGLVGAVFGILDRDDGEIEGGNVYVLQRYAIENYILDPILVYAYLLDRDQAPKTDFEMKPSEVGGIRDLDNEKLQKISDAVISVYEPAVREELGAQLDSQRRKVTYSNGKSIEVPSWLFTKRGHNLLAVFGKIAPPGRHREELVRTWKRVRLVPVEFRAVFEKAIGLAPEAEPLECAEPDHSDAPSMPAASPARTTADQEPRPAPFRKETAGRPD